MEQIMTRQKRKMNKYERREKYSALAYKVIPVFSILLLILLWYWAASGENSVFPTPAQILDRFFLLQAKPIMSISLPGHILKSLLRVFTALLIAWTLGIALGVMLGWNEKFNAVVGPFFTVLRAVPPLALIPLITIWFGIGEFPKILVVLIGAIIPVVVNTQAGISNSRKMFTDVGAVFKASKRQQLFYIIIPSAMDAIFAGVKTSTSTAWTVVLAAEMLGAKSGVGFLIVRGMNSGDFALVLLSMLCIGLVGAFLAIFIQILERLVCPWKAGK